MNIDERAERRAERARREAEIEARREAARRIVATGKCPQCGRALRHNNALTGWWQCEQFGAEQFRKDPSADSCSFQIFT